MKVLILVTLVEILFVFCEGSNGRGRNLYISEEDQDMIIMYHNDVRRNETGHSGFQELVSKICLFLENMKYVLIAVMCFLLLSLF